MKINPKKLSWEAPTTNVDGTPIDYEVDYELGIEVNGVINPFLVVPAQLNELGGYEAPIADMGFDYGEHVVALRTFAKNDPTRKSVWSNTVNFIMSRRIPKAPTSLSVA